MKIIYIATGAANMFCGSCMHDNALAAGMKTAGEDVTMFPLYTPMRLDEENVGERKIFFGGIKAYLLQKYPHPFLGRDLLLRIAGAQAFLRLMPRFDIGSAVDPVANAEMTVSMLKGESGNQRELLDEFVGWVKTHYQPDIIHITNALMIGVARQFKHSLQVPITCGLHGEDIFLEGLPQPYQNEALKLIRERAQDVDRFLAISGYYGDMFSKWVGLDASKIDVVWPGIALDDYRNLTPDSSPRPLTIGFFARFVPEKGLHLLVDAFLRLARSGEFPNLQLLAGGYVSRAYKTYLDGIRKTIRDNRLEDRVKLLGTLERDEKLNFFRQIDVFSVPAPYREPKGISILEALAAGAPVVQPDHGAYPEWVNATKGGILHRPHDSADLAEKLAILLRDAELRRQLGQQGRQGIFENFSSEKMTSAALEVMRRLGKTSPVAL
ncbi:MAG: glycosyl transferase family 1 [Anaerolineaceae bacterium]|nr:glycosyltransferase family 1 protein [Anaerolineae bacterium]MCL4823327.1 glycosyltransferase family 4 protein [Anaerolineales bacterium]MDL1925453.1 glycosyltransferase family 4 protein [Anaerolineae bacterium AMX1]GIK09944.1 MAG: glycosyl transferase family 1 [Chloroflexota bacterium]GJQ38953.1 MAG: glycosyl transferase family 1 [Anaerolineaceae bacterium]